MSIQREEFIRLLIESLEIKGKHRDYIERLIQRINPYFETESDLYRIVTDIVIRRCNPEDVLSPRRQKFIKSLEKSTSSKGIRSLMEMLPDEKFPSPLEVLIHKEQPDISLIKCAFRLDLKEILVILEEELDNINFALLKQFIESEDLDIEKMNITYEYLLENIPKIKERLEIIAKHTINGRLIIPKKKIVSVFEDGELFKFKSGIPYSKIFLIYQAHEKGMSIEAAAKYAGVNKLTVKKYWEEHKMRPNFKSFKERKLPDSIVTKIYEAHKKGMSLSQAAEYAGGIHISTVSDYWAKKGLKPHYVPRRGVQKSKVDEEKLIKIIEANKRGMSLREAARFAEGISSTVIQKRWKRMGLKSPHEQYKRLTQSSIERIYEARKNGMSIREAAEYAGVAAGTVSRYWKQLLDNQTMKHQ